MILGVEGKHYYQAQKFITTEAPAEDVQTGNWEFLMFLFGLILVDSV